MKISLGGHLSWHDDQKRSRLEMQAGDGILLSAVLEKLTIPRGEVALVSINGELFEGEDVMLKDTDTLLLFPPIGGG